MKRIIATAIFVVLLPHGARAQWSTNSNFNNVISTAAFGQYSPTITSDGAGGAIITWQDNRGGINFDIYAQRINANGVVQWATDGVAISTAAYNQQPPTIVSDGAGGAIITWHDFRSGTADIYAQRINANGVVQWTADGVAISTAAYSQQSPTIVSDGAGGAIITWYDGRSGASTDIYAQRINGNGGRQWIVSGDSNGVAISTAANSQQVPTIISDEAGGAIITWFDFRSGTADIYAQRINANGARQWIASGDSNGVAISTAAYDQQYPTIVSDGAGGAIITWHDARSGASTDIYAQRINANGLVQWTANGVAISTAANYQYYPTIISDGVGGAIITWYDLRSGTNYDIYAQRINADGAVQWTTNGVAISTAANNQMSPTIVSDGAGGAIITWHDVRSGTADIYAQRINANGLVQWTANGVAISTAASDQFLPVVTSDGAEGAIITWNDYRSGYSDIYAQKVDRYGYLGDASPHIAKVRDVPNDQGGKVAVLWNHSYLDTWPDQTITSYMIWLGVRPAAFGTACPVLPRAQYIDKLSSGENTNNIYFTTFSSPSTSTNPIYWQSLASVSPHWLEGYSYNVTTPSDSGPQGTPKFYFMVTALTTNPLTYWDSQPDSGYSVDNLPPIAPPNASLLPLTDGPIKVEWNRDLIDPDVGYYAIYRSNSSGFPLNGTTRLATTTDTTKTDSTTLIGQHYYYRVTTVDIHGNQSIPTAELSTTALAVELSYFTAAVNSQGSVLLEWMTVSEVNNYSFEVERRRESETQFQTLPNSFIPGHGTTSEPQHYSFTDHTVPTGQWAYRLKRTDSDGSVHYGAIVMVDVLTAIPAEFALEQNYPNPFNPTTEIRYQVAEASHVRLNVYDMLGRLVATLVDETQNPGYKSTVFDSHNVPSGIYVYRLTAGKFTAAHKMVLLR